MLNKVALFLLALIPNGYVIGAWLGLGSFTHLLFTLVVGIVLIKLMHSGFKVSRPSKIDLYLLLLVSYMLLSTLQLSDPKDGFLKIFNFTFAGLSLIYFSRLFLKETSDFLYLFKCLIYSSIGICIVILIVFVGEGMPVGRFFFYGAHPIPVSMVAANAIMLTLILYTQKQVKLTTFALSVIAGLGVIIISSSKGPLLGLVITIVLFAPIIFSNLKVFITTVSLFLITQIYLSSYEQYNAFIVRLLNTSADQSTSIRLNIYNEASNAFSNNPIIGEGVGFFSDYYPHNVVLEFLSEGGLLLGSFLIVFLVWLVWTFFRSFNSIRNPLFVCGIALTILSFCVLMVSFTYTDLKFLYLGVGVSLQFLTLYEKSKSDYKKQPLKNECYSLGGQKEAVLNDK